MTVRGSIIGFDAIGGRTGGDDTRTLGFGTRGGFETRGGGGGGAGNEAGSVASSSDGAIPSGSDARTLAGRALGGGVLGGFGALGGGWEASTSAMRSARSARVSLARRSVHSPTIVDVARWMASSSASAISRAEAKRWRGSRASPCNTTSSSVLGTRGL